MTLCISVALPELALVASTTRVSHTGPGGEWLGPREDRTGEFVNVRRVGGGPARSGWCATFGAPVTWSARVFAELEQVNADDVDQVARTVAGATEWCVDQGLERRIPPEEQNPERWPGGVQLVHPWPWGFVRATVYGQGEIWGREYPIAYSPPIELRTGGLPQNLRDGFAAAVAGNRTLAAVLRATAQLFHTVYELTDREAGSIGQLVEVGILRIEMLPGQRWQLNLDYVRPTRAAILAGVADAELAALIRRVDPLPLVEDAHAAR
ncbi:MAG TPA: hypothetical protein VKQ05_12945 [Gemmatimonadales bacterium]|nr:hypothetical protein [Gemmatimonadales bacterium]